MDRIMPIDLEQPELRKKLRGYETTAVDRLLLGAAKSLQALLHENEALRLELDRQKSQLDSMRAQEQTLKEVLVVAQRAAEDTRSAAKMNAEATLEEARQSAMSEKMATQQKLSEIRWEIDRLKAERSRYADEFRSLLERHQRELAHIVGLTVVTGDAGDMAVGA